MDELPPNIKKKKERKKNEAFSSALGSKEKGPLYIADLSRQKISNRTKMIYVSSLTRVTTLEGLDTNDENF